MSLPILVGHCAPDLDCLAGLWMLRRWGGYAESEVRFLPAGQQSPEPGAIHVDTGAGPFDHHDTDDHTVSSAEFVRRSLRPDDWALEELVAAITADDHARSRQTSLLGARDLLAGLQALYPHEPLRILVAMEANFDAWYAAGLLREEQRRAFADRIEFDTRWGLGVAVESASGVSSRDAYGLGAVLFAYRDKYGWMGVVAQSHSAVDLSDVYAKLQTIDGQADWFLHPNRRLLLCGTPKAPARICSSLMLDALIDLLME